jgi:hypothetical protein
VLEEAMLNIGQLRLQHHRVEWRLLSVFSSGPEKEDRPRCPPAAASHDKQALAMLLLK